MKISIVIISKNNRKDLNSILGQLLEIRKKHDFEIVVVEATNEEDLECEAIKYIKIPVEKAGFGSQRNIGVENSEGELVLFVDDDVILTKNWYQELTSAFSKEKNILAVMGSVFPLKPSLVGFCEGALGHPGGGFRLHHHAKNKIMTLNQVATLNTIFKRSALEEAGLFDKNLKYGAEDTDISIRISKKFGDNQFRYDPEALVYHRPRNRIDKIIPWYIRRGRADADLLLKHSTHFGYLITSSILLKITAVLLLGLILKNFLPIIAAAFLLWYLSQLYRYRFMPGYFKIYNLRTIKKVLTFLAFPLIKFLADLMFDCGRLLRFFKL